MRIARLIPFGLALAACATIEHQADLHQKLDKQLEAGVGDIVVSITKQRDLENVFGRADLYGRKTDEGSIEVRYLGTDQVGNAVFARRESTIQTDETVFNRGPGTYIPNTSSTTTTGSIGGTPVSASSTTTGTGTFIPARPATKIILPEQSVAIVVDPQRRRFIVSGFAVDVFAADSTGVKYQISRLAETP